MEYFINVSYITLISHAVQVLFFFFFLSLIYIDEKNSIEKKYPFQQMQSKQQGIISKEKWTLT